MRGTHLAISVLLAAATSGPVVAARTRQPTQPATVESASDRRRMGPGIVAPAMPEGPLKVVVLEAAGLARYRNSSDQPWQMLRAGMELSEGVELSTGPKSFIRVQIGDAQQTTFDRLGTYAITRAAVESGTIKTDTIMKYGRTRCEIEAAGQEHDAVVRSASSTLAVRGTVTELYDQPPFAPQAVSYTGQVQFRDARRQVRLGSRGGGTVRLDAGKNSPAETALATTVVDPTIAYARSPSEQRLIEQVIATGGIIGFEEPGGIPIVRGGTPPAFEAIESAIVDNGLSFVLKWTGNADLNMSVVPIGFGEIIAPITSLNRGNTGGVTGFDHRGGANGGFEVLFYPPNYPGADCNPTQTYVDQIGYVSGETVPFERRVYVRDPVTGQQVLVSVKEGTLGASTATFTERFVNPPPCPPGAPVQFFSSDPARAAKPAKSAKAPTVPPRGPQVLVGPQPIAPAASPDCNCPAHAQPAKATRKK